MAASSFDAAILINAIYSGKLAGYLFTVPAAKRAMLQLSSAFLGLACILRVGHGLMVEHGFAMLRQLVNAQDILKQVRHVKAPRFQGSKILEIATSAIPSFFRIDVNRALFMNFALY